MKPLWIVQSNLFNELGYANFMESLERMECDYQIVKPVPFTDILLVEDFDSSLDDAEDPTKHVKIDTTRTIIGMGTISLTRSLGRLGARPAHFHNDNFHYEKWRENWGNKLLNPVSYIGKASTVKNVDTWPELFVRPTEDTKAISGTVMSAEDFVYWQLQMGEIEDIDPYNPMHKDTEIVIAPVKKILREYRMFVIDGVVVTGSMYKQGRQVIESADVPFTVYDFTLHMADKWKPSDAFVLDVADTPEGYKVIEVNTINSAGIYAADTQKIIYALEQLVMK